MAPVALDGHQTPLTNNNSNSNNNGNSNNVGNQEVARGGSISLGMLIDLIVQRTYHELTVLAELLPRKIDMERKIEIFNFSGRTRQLFVRLLALVKWANSASKVDKSAHIMAFLDKQSMLFVDTADLLARMSRETLVHARLPNFHIPAAVEVLTTGSYNRLPLCIRDRIVPPDPITTLERKSTLLRLNQVIQHRLVTGNLMSQMKNLKIENGRVTFHIENEFEVSLTVMGDGPNIPWRLLDIDILVEDKETGDGKALVHSLQVSYIHQVLQTRLVDHPNPLAEVYTFLHYFCQSLQLEVLYTQTLRLIKDRLDGHIHVDEYTAGKCLVISYWRELTNRELCSEVGFKLTILVDTHDPARPLQVLHIPTLGTKESEIADRAIRSEHLSMERLLVHSIYVRTKSRLNDLKTEVQAILKDVECTVQGSPAVLFVPVLSPCLSAENLLIAVDTHTGMLHCHVPKYDPPIMSELQNVLNSKDHSRLSGLISELRYWITQRRCEKTLQHLPATIHERMPTLMSPDHPMTKLEKHRMTVRLNRHPNVILVVEFKEKENSPTEIEYKFYLARVKQASIEDNPNDENIETEIPKMYLRVLTLVEFDTFITTHGPFTAIDENDKTCGKRKYPWKMTSSETPSKKLTSPPYFIPELAHAVAMCDERMPFVTLSEELNKRNIAHQGLQVEANATALVLRIVDMPCPAGISKESRKWLNLNRLLLSLSIRAYCKSLQLRSWIVEMVMFRSPLATQHPKEQGNRRPIYFQYEMLPSEQVGKIVDGLLNDWAQIVYLYTLVEDLAEYFKSDKYNISSMISVKSYNYSKLVLSYGPDRGAYVIIQWNPHANAFTLIFGSSNNCLNAHNILREQLEAELNRQRNLMHLIQILYDTYSPIVSISKLPTIPQLGIHISRPQVPVQTFTIIAESTNVIRVAYLGLYCLEVKFKGGGLVTLRDAAYSRFDRTSVVNEFTPTPGLKTFLSKYVDETVMFRRRSQCEDDNPPSPIALDSTGGDTGSGGCTPNQTSGTSGGAGSSGFLSNVVGHRGGPQSPAQARTPGGPGGTPIGGGGGTPGGDSSGSGTPSGLRFHHPPMTPPSNPHTPASPHTANIQSHGQSFGSSPAASFNLASPPSLPPPTITPSPSILPHPSPSSGLLANSPSNPLHVPSPMPISPGPSMPIGHSPASSLMGHPGHTDGSPFTTGGQGSISSPAASNWPASPSMPRPSPRSGQSPHPALHSPDTRLHGQAIQGSSSVPRVLPQKSWAGAVPTLISHEALEILCTPSPHPQGLPGPELAPIERFLGCVYMRRQLQRIIQTEDILTSIPTNEPGVVHFKVEHLQCRVVLNPVHLQSLHLKVTPENPDAWTLEELQIIEKYFETKAAAPPYKPNSICCFCRFISVTINELKDIIQIMKLELIPSLISQHGFKWSIQLCLRAPPSAGQMLPLGLAAVLLCRGKFLFFVQITRMWNQGNSDPPTFIFPLVHDQLANITQLADKRELGTNSPLACIANTLKEFQKRTPMHECSLFPSVTFILANMMLPSEPQIESSPAGMIVGNSMQSPASNMMHSPMQYYAPPAQPPQHVMGPMGGSVPPPQQ